MNNTNRRPLRGSCECGRNIYIIQFPSDFSHDLAKVLFNSSPSHSTLLPAHLRIPLTWYHSLVLPSQPDETNSQIHRVYHSVDSSSMRHFCGFCGTPLSYWSENPRTEKDYIQLALASLFPEDLGDLEELGLLPSSEEVSEDDEKETEGRSGIVPWLDSLVQGSKLGDMRKKTTMKRESEVDVGTGVAKRVIIEWEVIEWDGDEEEDVARLGKRKLGETNESARAGHEKGVKS
ncbi:hypothetical protein QBC38DRAFT_43619 [Podospora fimiseda]|uniref:CENP-V/GFA domain-containing protein n=1 Tax=Podospora fimiseda TaxID=252190 RepID=A0AAN7BI65_9PEZI|nr:hypothetical protein QBC38DRAFT_43619 [Podospora fimiseda]